MESGNYELHLSTNDKNMSSAQTSSEIPKYMV